MQEMGPNAKKLFLKFVARVAVPEGGGIADGMRLFTDAEHRQQVWKQARVNFDVAMQAVKSAPDNRFGDDDEAIAAEILRRLRE